MDRLDALRAFVLSVDRGSLAAAAKALRCSAASLTRAIDSLEGRVGTPLLVRTTRSLRLTDAGECYLEVARRVLNELEQAERLTTAVASEPQGLLSVTAPVAFGALHVQPVLSEFLGEFPKVQARLLLLDRVVNLLEEGMDLAVRLGQLPDSSLVAVTLGSVRHVVVASPSYLQQHGRPKRPSDLASHRCIVATALAPQDSWSFGARAGGRPRRVRIRPVLSVNVVDAAIRAALGGLGITSVLSYQVAEQLAQGTLVRLLTTFEPAPVPVQLVYSAASARTAKIRAFVEFGVPRLKAVLRT
jgi:DNA-binding transcriptional LysR family regulator